MATQLFLRDEPMTDYQHAREDGWLVTASTRIINKLATTRGDAGVTSHTKNTEQLFGQLDEILDGSNRVMSWMSDPVSADVTISGTITFNAWALESSMSANYGLGCRVWRVPADASALIQIVNSLRGIELGTAAAVQNWTAAPTSTALQKGDRLMVAYGYDDIGTSSAGFTVQFHYDGPTAAADGDTYITFNETFSFMTTTPAGSKFYFRDLDETTATGDADFNSKQLTTGRGSTATSKRSLVTGGTGGGSYSIATDQFVGDTSVSNTDWMSPGSAVNVDQGSDPDWVNPSNALTDDGSVASVTPVGGVGNHSELHFRTFGSGPHASAWNAISGRCIASGARIEARQVTSVGIEYLACASQIAFNHATGNLTTTMTLYTSDGSGSGLSGASPLATAFKAMTTPVYFHDDGTFGNGGRTTEVDYMQYKVYYQTIYEWFSFPCQAFTLSGLVLARLRGARASGFASPDGSLGCQIAVVNGDGTSPTVFGWGFSPTDTTSTEATLECIVAGDDIAVTSGQRIRVRVVACGIWGDHYGGGFSNTDFFYDGPTADASGDSWIQLTETVSESAGPAGGILRAHRADRDRYRVAHR